MNQKVNLHWSNSKIFHFFFFLIELIGNLDQNWCMFDVNFRKLVRQRHFLFDKNACLNNEPLSYRLKGALLIENFIKSKKQK